MNRKVSAAVPNFGRGFSCTVLRFPIQTEFLRSTVLWCTLVPRIKQRIGGYFSVPLSFVEVTSARSEAWDDWLNMLRQQALCQEFQNCV